LEVPHRQEDSVAFHLGWAELDHLLVSLVHRLASNLQDLADLRVWDEEDHHQDLVEDSGKIFSEQ